MLTEEQLEYISNALIPLFQHLEHEVIADIAARIKNSLAYTRTQELRAQALYELGYSPARIRKEAMKIIRADAEFRKQVAKNTLEYQKMVKKRLREIEKEAAKAGDKIFSDVGDLAYLDDLRTWKQEGKVLTDDSFLPNLVDGIRKQTEDDMSNLTRTTGFKGIYGFESIEKAYTRELDRALIKITSGVYSGEEVIYDVIHNLSQSGLRTIDYKSGRSRQLDTGVKIAVRTGAHQLIHKIKDNNFLQSGENLVYVSKHIGARNTGTGHANHEEWQGKVYYVKPGKDYSEEAKRIGQQEIKDMWEATGYSIDGEHENDPLGFLGYNCRHTYYIWHEGSSMPKDFKEEKAPPPVEINGKMYDYYAMTQKQRAMERNIRALKREREAMNKLQMDTKEINKKIRTKIKEYEDFCKKYNMPEEYNNIRYDAGSSNLKKTKTWQEYEEKMKNDKLSNYLGAFDKEAADSEPQKIGTIDPEKTEEALQYFGNEIRELEDEAVVIIDKSGNVYYNIGKEDTVSFGSIDLHNTKVLHNHPKSNGIVSFGEDDFNVMREYQDASFRLVNEEYDYRADVMKPMDGITYNMALLWVFELYEQKRVSETEDIQHVVMECLKERGYISYERRPYGNSETQD